MKLHTPSFFCVGAQKSGTTALHHHLSRHPAVFLPSVKETHFFDDGHGEWPLGIGHYLANYFDGAPQDALAGEIDPEYLFFPEVPARLAQYFPAAKLIFILREPISRAYSHYWMTVRRGREPLDFADALDAESERMRGDHLSQSDFSYSRRGFYFEQVSRYLKYFPRGNLFFLLSEDLKREPQETLRRIYAFLDLPSIPYVPISEEESHQAYMPVSMGFQGLLDEKSRIKRVAKALLPVGVRRPMMGLMWWIQTRNRKPFKASPMAPALRAHLRDRFAPDIRQLQELIGRDLSHWLAEKPNDAARRASQK
ncbi:MAG: sulfotransferase [Hydrogenophilales bacterium]|nr:sulfotransferase [Hydrogenophilales bacterium]